MSSVARGGRGKKAPYDTQMYRIPVPIKPVVEGLAAAYRMLVDQERIEDFSILLKAVVEVSESVVKREERQMTSSNSSQKVISDNKVQLSKSDELYKYNSATERIRVSINPNSDVAELKAEVSRLKDELGKAQKAIASQRNCIDLIDEFLELEGADRQGITARQRISEALTNSRKQARFTMLAKFQTWLIHRD